MPAFFDGVMGKRIAWAVYFALLFLGLFLMAETISAFQGMRYIGAGIQATNTIQVLGQGEVYAVPDMGDFTFSVVSDKATVKDAQDDAAAKSNAVAAYLKSAGVAGKDIKTTDYTVSPRYNYQSQICPQGSYCPGGRQVLVGYEVAQTTDVKVRDTSKAGDFLAGVGSKGATNVSSLQFTVDDPTAVQMQARDKAIADAKAKAEKLASELGVSLVRVTAFSENQGGSPMPMALGAAATGVADKSVAPEISVGQNKVTDNVTITYEIR